MVTRISGLASGMDIDTVVKNLMTARSAPLNKMNTQKQLLEWKRESYRETSTKLVSFLQDKLDKLSLSSSINAQKATVTGNTSAVSAVATSNASGVMDIVVNNLATASRAVSTAGIGKAGGDLVGLAAGDYVIGSDKITLTAEDTIDSLVQKINSNSKTGVTAIYDKNSGLSLTSKTTGTDPIKLDTGFATAFKLENKDGTNASLTVNGLLITQASNSFELNGVKLTLNSKTPATESTHIEITKDTDKLVANVQSFVDAYNEVLTTMNSKVTEERYSKYTPLTTEQKADMSDDEVALWTTKAKSGMLKNDSILQSTISEMRTAMIQGVNIDRPMLDENGDPVLGTDGKPLNKPLMLTELGITTGTYDTRGKLILDTDKLTAALNSDPDILTNFFGKKDPANLLSNEYTAQDGVFAKLKKITNVSLQRMAETAGTSRVSSDLTSTFINTSTMGEELTSLDRRISDMIARLARIETSYFKKFTAMETAISRYNNTSSSLTSMLS